MLLSHITKTKYENVKKKYFHESDKSYQGSIFNFLEKCGYSFNGSYKITNERIRVYELKANNKKYLFFLINLHSKEQNSILCSESIMKPKKEKEFLL